MKIEIKPGDQSWVGKKIVNPFWGKSSWHEVLAVGQERFFGRDRYGNESAYYIYDNWELYQEPKPKRLLAPALYQEIDRDGWAWFVSHMLYSSLEEAKRDLDQHSNVRWPAIPNAQGYYEVEDE